MVKMNRDQRHQTIKGKEKYELKKIKDCGETGGRVGFVSSAKKEVLSVEKKLTVILVILLQKIN